MEELNNSNSLHCSAKQKIYKCACDPTSAHITRTAERDLSLFPVTKIGILDAIRCHIDENKMIYMDYLDSGESAYILKECCIESVVLYVKVKFFKSGSDEKMLILSAHPDRKW